MGHGQPTSRPTNYVVELEVLLQAKNDRIAELETDLVNIKDSHADEWMKRTELEDNVVFYKKKIAELEVKLADRNKLNAFRDDVAVIYSEMDHTNYCARNRDEDCDCEYGALSAAFDLLEQEKPE